MAKKNRRILTVLGAALGTGLAVYGISQGVRRYRQQQLTSGDYSRYPESAYQLEQPPVEPIPATGPLPIASPLAGTAGSLSNTGLQDAPGQFTSIQTPDIVMDEYVAPLIEHAIAFYSVMNLLRSRQREGTGYEGTESLTEGDRASMRAVLDQMQEHLAVADEGSLRKSPLAMRSYRLTRRLRDALDNLDYTGADLYRIHREVSKDLCVLARELETSGQVTITGLDHIRQLYECQ